MKEIKLTKGFVALVNDEDFEWLNQFNWTCKINKHTKYACRKSNNENIWMHRLILGISKDSEMFGDHIDFNGLNNQRENLRIATRKQNNSNKRSAKKSTSKFIGVSFCKCTNKWRATIFNNYKQISLGRFNLESDAAVAYNNAADKYHGIFANLNKINP